MLRASRLRIPGDPGRRRTRRSRSAKAGARLTVVVVSPFLPYGSRRRRSARPPASPGQRRAPSRVRMSTAWSRLRHRRHGACPPWRARIPFCSTGAHGVEPSRPASEPHGPAVPQRGSRQVPESSPRSRFRGQRAGHVDHTNRSARGMSSPVSLLGRTCICHVARLIGRSTRDDGDYGLPYNSGTSSCRRSPDALGVARGRDVSRAPAGK